jgi:hypothetical protein
MRIELHSAIITSDAVLPACSELDNALGLTKTACDYLHESRKGYAMCSVSHVPLLRQSIYSHLAAYENTNDIDRLSQATA